MLRQARKIWRERNLAGVETIERPVDKIKHILTNYKDHGKGIKEIYDDGKIIQGHGGLGSRE